MSLSPICHCQVSPTVGCHRDEAELGVADCGLFDEEDIKFEFSFETGSILGEDEAAGRPIRNDTHNNPKPRDV